MEELPQGKFLVSSIYDGFAKSRHSRAGGNPESAKILKRQDSRFQHRGMTE
jgi:hypothetical protein